MPQERRVHIGSHIRPIMIGQKGMRQAWTAIEGELQFLVMVMTK